MKSKEINMLSGPIFKSLLVLSLPIMISSVLSQVFNIIDMTMLKQFHSGIGYAVGSVGVCGPLITLITGVFTGCSTGVNVATSKRLGRGNSELVERVAGTSLLLFVVLGLFLLVVGVLGARTMLLWVNCDEALLGDAILYFRLYFIGFPLSMVYTACAALIRASGYDILSTNRGYIIQEQKSFQRTFKVQHTEEQVEEEMNGIVDLGGKLLNVRVNHKVYGRMEAELNIGSRRKVNEFMEDIRKGKSSPLMKITSNYHYHLVEAESEEILDEIEAMLDAKGILIR
jgi:transcriptional regulator of NAD metabolism